MVDTKLHTLEDRAAVFVNDAGFLIYTAAQFEIGMRQALDFINFNLGQAYTIEGLNAAAGSSLPGSLESVVVQGAAAFTVSGQAAAQVLSANAAPGSAAALAGWAKEQLRVFVDQVEKLRLQALQSSTSAPYSAVTWEEDDGDA